MDRTSKNPSKPYNIPANFSNKPYHLLTTTMAKFILIKQLTIFLPGNDSGDKDCTTDSVLVAVTLTVLEASKWNMRAI